MSDRWKSIYIGIFITAAFGVIVFLILFLKPTIGDGKKNLKVRFTNIASINKGTRVTYAGRPVGQVVKIEEIPNARTEKTDANGRIYYYQLDLSVDSSIDIYKSDEISICTSGLMGERSIAILPKAPPSGETLQKTGDEILYSNSIDPFENTINHLGKAAAKADKALAHFDEWFTQNSPALARTAANLGDVAHSMDSVLKTIDNQNLIPSIKESLELVSDNMREIHSAISDDRLLSRLSSLIADLNEAVVIFSSDGANTLANLNQITHDIATGTGTLGRLLNSEDFYLRFNSLMSKSETLMNDINHYGLLFQYNKKWQKSRTQKANVANALESPKEFREFFEHELDEIGASLGRVSDVLDRADQGKERGIIMQNSAFQRDFTVLMRQVKALNDAIRLFNQDLVSKWDDAAESNNR
jgi:phospholipid/cholesterol/gamma-HCH transport system substrate-binding protein